MVNFTDTIKNHHSAFEIDKKSLKKISMLENYQNYGMINIKNT
ncbi:hypothetical protein F7308_1919 [Francisella salina]|uniref:Uncharacterized protein n=1 Tax=Francisella salina TaxID=573569 RepID=A0ABM5MCG7_FRAST|nr:hypothetical protein F7308_1919 [Francisella salina]